MYITGIFQNSFQAKYIDEILHICNVYFFLCNVNVSIKNSSQLVFQPRLYFDDDKITIQHLIYSHLLFLYDIKQRFKGRSCSISILSTVFPSNNSCNSEQHRLKYILQLSKTENKILRTGCASLMYINWMTKISFHKTLKKKITIS